ncbi:MAG: glycosyltransferase family 39 protein [Candidatus Moranbacteria bacterium]|nr:glycosyltransferase family 39 protein [Candidatus Moranbacteria bacterium]
MKERIITAILFLVVVGTSFGFGFHRLGSFSGVDEPLWVYDRVPNFWKAIGKMKWKKTALCDKPGIVLDAVSGAGLLFADGNPKEIGSWRYKPKTEEQLQAINSLYFHLRLPVFLFVLAMLVPLYALVKRWLGKPVARPSLVFIGLSPVLLGISLMVNTDALLWGLLSMSLLSFFVYQKENSRKFLCLSGFLLGLALIDKFVANILFPFFFGMIFLEYIFGKEKDARYFKKSMVDFGILLLVSIATIAAFFPAAWVKPEMVLETTIFSKAFHKTWIPFFTIVALAAADAFFFRSWVSKGLGGWIRKHRKWLSATIFTAVFALVAFVFLNTYSGMKVFDFQPVFDFPSLELKDINLRFSEPLVILLSSFFPLLFSLTPLVLFFFIWAVIQAAREKLGKTEARGVLYVLVFILFYYAGSAMSGVAPTPRYQIVLYPLVSIVAAIGLAHFASTEKLKKYFVSKWAFPALLLALAAVSVWPLCSIEPHYLAYASDLLPGKYVTGLRNMGSGNWEAAQYLNSLPDAKNLKIWSDQGGVCEAFVGTCVDNLKPKNLETKFDYFVVSAGRKSKSVRRGNQIENPAEFNGSLGVNDLYDEENPYVFRLDIGGRSGNFVKVIKAENHSQEAEDGL